MVGRVRAAALLGRKPGVKIAKPAKRGEFAPDYTGRFDCFQ
jgi:hypothetical protein